MAAAGGPRRICLCLFFAFFILGCPPCSFSASAKESMALGLMRKSLKVRLDDYGEASANHGHDPRNIGGSGGDHDGGGDAHQRHWNP